MNVQSDARYDEENGISPADAAHSESLFELTDLVRVGRARHRIILGTALIVVALTTIALFRLTPLFTGNALVMLDQRQNKVADVDAILSGLPTDPTSIENQVQILRSRSLMSRVIDKLGLLSDPEFGDAKPSPVAQVLGALDPLVWFGGGVSTKTDQQKAQDQRDWVIDRMLTRLTVASQGRSSAILVSFESDDAQKAQQVTNEIAEAYVEDQLNAKFEATQKVTQWMAGRIGQLARQVQIADAAVQSYRADHNLNEAANGDSIVDQQLGQLNAQLVTAKSDLAEQEAKYSRVVEMSRSGHADAVSQVVDSPLIAQMRGQENELLRQEADLSSKYGPRHPKMLDLESQKRNLIEKIAEEVQRVVQTVGNDVAVARARVSSLQGSLNELEGQSTVQNKDRVKLRELEASATSSRSLYEAFLGRLKETQGQEGIQTPDARIVSRSEAPTNPSFPNKVFAYGVALPGGLLLGFLFAMLAERLDAGFRTTQQVERVLNVPVLSTLPEIPNLSKTKASAADRIIEKPMSSFAEAIRGLQLGLSLSNLDHKPKVILITSSVPDEGKTTVAISLARLAARMGQKVALIDADLRRPSIARSLNLENAQYGLVEALSGAAPIERCFQKDPRSTVNVLATMQKAKSPPDILGSVAMERMVKGLKGAFDLVVIDSAPLLPVNDTKVLSRVADAVLFVVRWEKTPRDAAIVAVRSLADSRATIAGVVLARADVDRYKYYAYGYQDYYAYNKYYSD